MRSEMKNLVGKSCFLEIDYHSKSLFYTVKRVESVTTTHISFIDKYNKRYSFRIKDIVQVNRVEG